MKTKVLSDGSIVNLSNLADSVRQNGQNIIDSSVLGDTQINVFNNMCDYIADKIECDQALPANIKQTALKIIYFNKDKYTIKSIINILNQLGK